MRRECILSIDQGTTGSRVHILDSEGNTIAKVYREFRQRFPRPGWIEHDPEEIWDGLLGLMQAALDQSGRQGRDVLAVGIANQRETTLIWDRRTGRPIHNAIVWQCRRTSDRCEELKRQGQAEMINRKSGLLIDAYFSATKLEWLLDNIENARQRAERGELIAGTIDSWLLYKLTGQHATDYTNASRTMLYNIEKKEWDQELLDLLHIPAVILPQVRPSRSRFGEISNCPGLSGVPVLAMMGDQQAALFGGLCVEPGSAKNTYGTGCFLLCNSGNRRIFSKSGLITTLACNREGESAYALEGAVFIAGAAIQWLRDSLHFFDSAADTERLISSLDDEADDIVFVPAFAGLGAPYWDMQARGAIFGLSRDSSAAHITRAALKSIALQSCDLVSAMQRETGERIDTMRVDGGAAANDWLMQFQADMLGSSVERPENLDTTALGSAWLAGLEAGLWSPEDLQKFSSKTVRFRPKWEQSRRQHELAIWHRAVERVRGWKQPL